MSTATAQDSHVETLLAEKPCSLSTAAKWFGEIVPGKPVHPTTLSRWCLKGVRLADGTRLKLESLWINRRLVTSRPAVIRFLERQNEPDASSTPTYRSPAQRNKAALAADARLTAAGF